MNWIILFALAGAAVVLIALLGEAQHAWRTRQRQEQPRRVYPPLGHYGRNNEDLPDISTGWHIFADGNAWCAVGPTFEDLVQSPAGFGYTPREAHAHLMLELKKTGVLDVVNRPELADFYIHMPTVKPDGR